MKFKLFFLGAALLAATVGQAQGLHFGVKGGANITKVEGKAMQDEFNYGYHLGGFAEIGLGKKWFIQPEVLWSQLQTQTGDNFEDIIDGAIDGSKNQTIKLNYLSIPISLNYRLLDWLSLQAGPQFGVLLDNNKNLLQNGKEAFDAGDISLMGGAQINFSAFRITGRYFTSLKDINSGDITSGDINTAWKNKGFQISLGIRIL
jgi:Outer membrane protein beta-barrel domain